MALSFGAAEGTRTPDFLLRRETLYPLSYSRAVFVREFTVGGDSSSI